MAFDPGYLAVTGFDACLAGDNILVDETGEAILDGYGDWILTEGCGRVVLPLQAWSCGLSGADTTCYQHRALSAGSGSVIVAGQACAIVSAKRITANLGVYNISGSSATLDKLLVDSKEMAAESGVYSGFFQLAVLKGARVGQLSPGDLSATWSNAGLARSLTIQPDPSTLAISGADASFAKIRLVSMPAYPGVMAWDGAESILARARLPLAADHGSIYGSGADASLATSLIIESGPGDYQQVFTDSIMEHGWGVFFPVIDFSHTATPVSFIHMDTETEFTPPQYGTEYATEIRQTTFSLA